MAQSEKRQCYQIEVSPGNHKQNCDMWDFDNLHEGNVYIKSIHFREFINIVSPMIVFGILSSASKMHFFDNMRGTFLGGASINAMKFFAPIVVFKKSFIPYVNDKMYSMCGQDQILQFAKDINNLLDGICSIEFILNWLGSCCLPYEKEAKEYEEGGGVAVAYALGTSEGRNPNEIIIPIEDSGEGTNDHTAEGENPETMEAGVQVDEPDMVGKDAGEL